MQQKGFSILLLLIVVMIIGGLTGGYWYFSQQPPTSQSPGIKRDVGESNLRTYQNDRLGFQFQYSKDLKVQEDSEEDFNKRGNGNFRKNFAYYVAYQPAETLGIVAILDETNSYETNQLTIWVFNNDNNLTIEQFYEKYWYYPFVWGDYTLRRNEVAPAKDATVSGQLAKSGIVTYQPGTPKFIYLSHNKKVYLFRSIGEEGEQLLQSFKLLNGSDKNTGGCVVAGCSGQLCVEEAEKDIITTCEFREEYACYKNAICEKQPDGKCGWTKTEELTQCLEEKRSSSPEVIF